MEYKNLSSEPITALLKIAGGKWKLLIIKNLLKKEMRFNELKKKLKCTSKVLISCLKEMEEDGLVIREQEEPENNKVEYYLADLGYTLQPVIESMQKWGREYKKLMKLIERQNL